LMLPPDSPSCPTGGTRVQAKLYSQPFIIFFHAP
jgi:hypothetical protein